MAVLAIFALTLTPAAVGIYRRLTSAVSTRWREIANWLAASIAAGRALARLQMTIF